jgi:hypothetical protein
MTTYDPTHSRAHHWTASGEPVSVRGAIAIIAGASIGLWGLIGWALHGLL